jgi:hypothetical protein
LKIRFNKGAAGMGIKQRVERLEGEIGLKQEGRITIITTISPDGDDPSHAEDPYHVEIFPGLWAYAARGGPFKSNEIHSLREKHKAKYEEFRAKGKFRE